jgi:bacterioferritin-associated ferredoxin
MPSNFIFVESVQEIIKNGGHEIRVSQGAKISPAAFDLIREKQIKIITEEAPPPPPPSEIESKDEPAGDVSKKDVEKITQMVIERLNELRTCEHNSLDKETSFASDDDLVICRCEEITKKEIKEVIKSGINTLNSIKRVTRSGMGLCQGQTCQTLVTRILAEELGVHPSTLEPTTARAPVRPVRLSIFAGQGKS